MASPRKKRPRMELFSQPNKELEELLLRLPADALTRFKCVNKSWRGIITNPSFITRHLKYVKTNCSESVLFGRSCGNIDDCRLSLLSALRGNSEDMRHVIEDLDIPLSQYIHHRRMTEWASIFHCDGMVCIQSEDFWKPINSPSLTDFMKPIDLIVCNPVLREFKIVPRPANFGSVNCQLIGFEYDSKAENYKIVKIVFGLHGVKAEVHTLGTTTWREIEINTPLDITMPHQYDYLTGSGVCYWAMQESPTGECKILCFDICDGVLQVIPFSGPTSFKDSVACTMWNGKLCVFLESIERVNTENACEGYSCQVESTNCKSTFEMWVMDTIEGDHHWTKHAVFGPLVDSVKPIKFWNNDELLLWVDSTRSFSFYNLRTQRFKNITVGGDALFLSCLYFKSLISVDGQKTESKI